MAIGIYKNGQGHNVRLVSMIALGVLVFMGAAWIWGLMGPMKIGGTQIEAAYVKAGAAVPFIAVTLSIGFWLIYRKPRTGDFLIACETEMKKVNWSTRREVIGSTWVVIILTLVVAAFCFTWDTVFQMLFKAINVLESGDAS